MTPEIYQQIKDFGITSCDEYVVPNPDGSYTIMLNARSATNRLEKAYKHAVEHILEGDLDQEDLDVNQIEMIRHGIEKATEKPMPAADWERHMRRLERARQARSKLTRRNIEDYVAVRIESADLLAEAEEIFLEP